jgi:hypothetical protein
MDGNAATVLDVATVREAYPDWRAGGGPGRWFAVRDGVEAHYGPKSLLCRCLSAPDLPQLAEKLGLQQYPDRLAPEELADAWKRVMPPPPENPS